MRKYYLAILMLICVISVIYAQGATPSLHHVFDIHARCGEQMLIPQADSCNIVVIPITGGSVDGEINAEILPGGADRQMVNSSTGRTELSATYLIKTDDGVVIDVSNEGIIYPDDKNYYFTTSPKFKAPVNSPYDWMNNRIFVCRPVGFEPGTVHLRVWVVE